MLIEMLEYRLTPDGPFSRDYDYLAQSVSLGARYRRQRRAWAPHVENCRRFILSALAQAPRGGRALVTGSGRLIEIPLAALADHFAEVVLLDMAQPMIVRRLARRYPHVRLMTGDVTGALAALSAALADGGPLPDPATMATPFAGQQFDFVLSANLASQLPLLPDEAIESRRPDIDAAARLAFGRGLIERHFAWLRRVGVVAALYSDVSSRWVDAAGREAARDDAMWGAALPAPDDAWDWLIAPMPEQEKRHDLWHRVAGWRDLNRPAGQAAEMPEKPAG